MSKGTYVAATDYELRTKIKIDYLIKSLKVPNPVDMKSLHTTLAYSRRELPLTKGTVSYVVEGEAKGLEIFHDGDKNTLVLLLDSIILHKLFKLYCSMGATYDYDEYKPHITLSVDVGDWEIPKEEFQSFETKSNSLTIEELDLNA